VGVGLEYERLPWTRHPATPLRNRARAAWRARLRISRRFRLEPGARGRPHGRPRSGGQPRLPEPGRSSSSAPGCTETSFRSGRSGPVPPGDRGGFTRSRALFCPPRPSSRSPPSTGSSGSPRAYAIMGPTFGARTLAPPHDEGDGGCQLNFDYGSGGGRREKLRVDGVSRSSRPSSPTPPSPPAPTPRSLARAGIVLDTDPSRCGLLELGSATAPPSRLPRVRADVPVIFIRRQERWVPLKDAVPAVPVDGSHASGRLSRTGPGT